MITGITVNFQERINIITNQNSVPISQYAKNIKNNNSNENKYKIKPTPKIIKLNSAKNNDIINKKSNQRIIKIKIESSKNGTSKKNSNNLKKHCLIYRKIKRNNGLETKNSNYNITSYSNRKQNIENNKIFLQNKRNSPNNIRSNLLLNNMIQNVGNYLKINNIKL